MPWALLVVDPPEKDTVAPPTGWLVDASVTVPQTVPGLGTRAKFWVTVAPAPTETVSL